MIMQTSTSGLNVIRSFEGRALRAYQDSVGVWTIGYGNTNMDKNAVKRLGPIGKGLTITAEQAENLFVESIRNQYEPAVFERLEPLGPVQAIFDAGVSFHYNTGAIAKATWPTALIKGDRSLAETSIKSWNKGKGTVYPGLTRRRNREWAMIDRGDYGPEASMGPMDLETRKQLAAPGTSMYPATPENTGQRVPGMLQIGDCGPTVRELNGYLLTLGWLESDEASTFTHMTEAAVRAFQGSHTNLTKDGKVGPATTASLQRDIKMRMAASKTRNVTGAVALVGTAAAATGWATVKFVFITAGLVGFAGLFFIVLNHRTELETLLNTLRGKQVP